MGSEEGILDLIEKKGINLLESSSIFSSSNNIFTDKILSTNEIIL